MTLENQSKTLSYNGHCAFAVSKGKTDIQGGTQNSIIDGKTYIFSNPITKFLFKLLPNRIEKADTHWDKKISHHALIIKQAV